MKKSLLLVSLLALGLVACGNKEASAPVEASVPAVEAAPAAPAVEAAPAAPAVEASAPAVEAAPAAASASASM